MRVLSAVACSFLLAACAPAGNSAGPAPSSAPAPSVSSSGPFDEHSTRIASARIILYSCVGRFSGDRSRWCTGTQMSGLLDRLTTVLRKDIGSRPDPALFDDVSAAIAGVEKSAGAVKRPCDDVSADGLPCLAAFNKMMTEWEELQRAIDHS